MLKKDSIKNNNIPILGVLIAAIFTIVACGGVKNESLPSPPSQQDSTNETISTIDWAKEADSAQLALQTEFWNEYQHYYNQSNLPNDGFNYWWQAHALDVLVDGYLRTNSPSYLSQMKLLLEGITQKNGQTMHNTFYDDMEWMGLACLRAYEATGNQQYKDLAVQLWDWIKVGWSEVKNGGIAWASGSPNSKNACSNAPAAILASRLYLMDKKPEDLQWALKIYKWLKEYVVDPSSGLVWDAYGNTNPGNIYTYNQGTFIGAALELYTITHENGYLLDATKNADYLISDGTKFSPGGILKGENTGDGGLFKGIFIRYLTELTLSQAIDEKRRQVYADFLKNNALSLITRATRRPNFIFGPDWVHQPGSFQSDCSVQLSAVMLLEAVNKLGGTKLN